MRQLAYVSHDGRVYTTDSNVDMVRPISGTDLICFWPTWARDGSRLAYSGLNNFDDEGSYGVYVTSSGAGESRLIYRNDPGTSVIARKTPHYMNWSPDGTRLAIVTQRGHRGLSLMVSKVDAEEPPTAMIDHGPLYSGWSRDSRFLLAHSLEDHYLIDFSRDPVPIKMPGTATMYMAPSWSPIDNRMAFCHDLSGGTQELMVGDLDRTSVKKLMELPDICSFQWSPDGTHVAMLEDLDRTSGFFSGLRIITCETGQTRQLTEDWVLGFFWSPGGEQIAYITPSDGAEGSVRWAVLSIASGSTTYLADFRPSQEQLITFMFFDQYAQSHSPWSPDGQYILFAGKLGYQLVRTELPESEETSIFEVPASGLELPTEVAKGSFGVFRPV